MNVASLELCRALYELSGWSGTFAMTKEYKRQIPAYDLGYLLRCLPYHCMIAKIYRLDGAEGFEFFCSPDPTIYDAVQGQRADSPEDAAAKLAIELFKHGVLERAA